MQNYDTGSWGFQDTSPTVGLQYLAVVEIDFESRIEQ